MPQRRRCSYRRPDEAESSVLRLLRARFPNDLVDLLRTQFVPALGFRFLPKNAKNFWFRGSKPNIIPDAHQHGAGIVAILDHTNECPSFSGLPQKVAETTRARNAERTMVLSNRFASNEYSAGNIKIRALPIRMEPALRMPNFPSQPLFSWALNANISELAKVLVECCH